MRRGALRAAVRGLERAGAPSRAHVPRAHAHSRRARRLLQQIETTRLDPGNVGLNFKALQKKLFETGQVQAYMNALFPGAIDPRDVRRPPAQLLPAG